VSAAPPALLLTDVERGTAPTAATRPRVMMRQIAGAFYQYVKARLVAKLKAARDRKRAAGGKAEGRRRWVEINPELVQEAKRLRGTSRSPPNLCARSPPRWQSCVTSTSAARCSRRRRSSRCSRRSAPPGIGPTPSIPEKVPTHGGPPIKPQSQISLPSSLPMGPVFSMSKFSDGTHSAAAAPSDI
jgi:hypothetical protein